MKLHEMPKLVLPLMFAEIISSFEISMIYSALPTLTRVFGDPAGVGWLVTAYLLVGSVSAGLSSRLGDLFGRRRVMLIMLAFSTAGSLVSLLSGSLGGLILGRALQGMSAALLPLAIGIVRERLPAGRVPVAVGWLAAMASFSAGAGLVLGGLLVDHLGWRTLFWFGCAHGLLALMAVRFWVPVATAKASSGSIDWLGGVLYAPAIALALYALTRIKAHGIGDPLTVGSLLAGLLLMLAWGRHEWRHAMPMIDVRRLFSIDVGLPMSLMFLFGLGAAQAMLVMMGMVQQPVWTGVGLGLSATMAGLIKLPSNFMGLLGAPWGGHLAARRGARSAAVLGTVLIVLGWIGLTLRHDVVWLIMFWIMVSSLGGSMMMATVPNLLVEVVSSERTSEFVGLSQVLRTMGTAIGTQVASVLLSARLVHSPTDATVAFPAPGAYLQTMLAITATCVLAGLVALRLPRQAASAREIRAVLDARPG